jgi:aspartate racemase
MKTIGLIGGMSWESSLLYYRLINQGVQQRLGGLHSAELLMHSVDFAPIENLQHSGDWEGASKILIDAARRLEVAAAVSAAVDIPLLHIADATAQALINNQVRRVGLLGTAFTMELEFYRERIERNGIEIVVPELHDRQMVHDIIYQELCRGTIDDDSREVYLAIIGRLGEQQIDGVILGCTEIGMLIDSCHTDMPLYDTTAIHAAQAVDYALQT